MQKYPFLYFYHGELDPDLVDNAGWAAIAFQEPVGVEDRKRIMTSCPEPFAGVFRWSDTLFTTESRGDIFDSAIRHKYGFGRKGLRRFAQDVEAWVTGVHERNPIVFFLGPAPVLGDDAWDAWSWKAVPEVVLPYLEQYADTHPESWREGGKGIDLAQMQSLLQHFDVRRLGGAVVKTKRRAKALLERYGMND